MEQTTRAMNAEKGEISMNSLAEIERKHFTEEIKWQSLNENQGLRQREEQQKMA